MERPIRLPGGGRAEFEFLFSKPIVVCVVCVCTCLFLVT